MSERVIEALRDKGRDYELNALAAKERGDTVSHAMFSALAMAMFELADVFDAELAEAA